MRNIIFILIILPVIGRPQIKLHGDGNFTNGAGASIMNLKTTQRVGVGGITSPTAILHLPGGTATANTAPFKLTTGTALTTPEDGAIEYHGSHLYFTINSTRYQLDQQVGSQTWQQTLTTGSTLTGNNTITGANTNFTWNDMNTFMIDMDVFALRKANGTFPYSGVIVAPAQQLWLAYTPTAGNFSKGAAMIIDTNNNVSIGSGVMPTTAPLYASGSAYIQGLQSSNGNFYRVTDIIADQTLSLTHYWINADATSNNIAITLPAASTAFGSTMGIQYVIRRADNTLANTITIQRAGSDTINGATSTTLTAQYQVIEIQAISTTAWAIK